MELMTHGSLFSGIGGAELAASWVEWKNIFHCEINPFGRKVIEYHFPESKSYKDVTKTDFSEYRGQIDVLTAGFPCQPFSVAGQRKGADDDRYLWPEVVRVIREVRPSWVVGENVAGILTMVQPGAEVEMGSQTALFGETDRKRVLLRQEYVIETICRDLEREGYSVQPLVIPACAVGAPHRRDRIWFIANRTDARVEAVQCSRKDRVSTAGAITNTESQQSELYKPEQSTNGSTEQMELGGSDCTASSKRSDTDTYGNGLQTRNDIATQEREIKGKGCIKPLHSIKDWRMFPTQSPICSRDDGLSFRLDGITFSKWRQESIKAYGNAWVPQVAYEIFKAIDYASKRSI